MSKHTLLFGNGFNHFSPTPISWIHLLNVLKESRKFNNGELPNTMIYERILLEKPQEVIDLLTEESKMKNEIVNLMNQIETNDFYGLIFDLKLENYLTTNYDYSLEKKIMQDESFSLVNNSTEDIYSIRRNVSILKYKNETSRIWHIHGEINLPKSIMLGLDHYCGSISKIDAYIKGSYDFKEQGNQLKSKPMLDKILTQEFDNRSWVELFFTTDVHLIGISLDFSEIDLWWILNKRARILKSINLINKHNKIYFYDKKIPDEKKGLLNAFDVQAIEGDANMEWKEYYLDVLKQIGKTVTSQK